MKKRGTASKAVQITFFIIFFTVFFSESGLCAGAGKSVPSLGTAKEISSFADALFEDKDYYRAVTEYKRLIFHFPGSPLSKAARLKIGLAYLEGGKYQPAMTAFQEVTSLYPDEPIYWEALFYLGETFYRMGDYENGLGSFALVEKKGLTKGLKERAAIKKGWSFVRMRKWGLASETFRGLAGTGNGIILGKLSDKVKEGSGIPRKSPGLAGVMSAILPGAGQLYIGRKKDAAVSFLLNGAFILGAIEAFRKEENAIGAILVFFEAGWYTGNVYSAVSGAHKFNRKKTDDFIRRLEQSFTIGISGNGGVYGLINLEY